jgi:hypothetical protein
MGRHVQLSRIAKIWGFQVCVCPAILGPLFQQIHTVLLMTRWLRLEDDACVLVHETELPDNEPDDECRTASQFFPQDANGCTPSGPSGAAEGIRNFCSWNPGAHAGEVGRRMM